MKTFAFLGLSLLACVALAADENSPEARAKHFVENEKQFHLGYLVTEQSHSRSRTLSQTLQRDTAAGVDMLLSVDEDIPPVARKVLASAEFVKLSDAILTALNNGHRVYISGCGATGRLAILLDSAYRRYWRKTLEKSPELRTVCGDLSERTRAVMTGGDFALIRSVEMFEDHISFGRQQMKDAGITEGDVLIAISEGGETSSVIGTVLEAVDAKASVFFVFNNPPDRLTEKLERCRQTILNPKVTSICLCTGPMAVAGSTRMQATTIELLVVGSALEEALTKHLRAKKLTPEQEELLGIGLSAVETLAGFEELLAQLRTADNLKAMARWTDFECDLYQKNGLVTYFALAYMLDIFTDTTERSPTFKLPPFRPSGDTNSPVSWAYVKDPLHSSNTAWQRVLGHEPNCLEWNAEMYRKLGAPEAMCSNPPAISTEALRRYLIGFEPDLSRISRKPNAAIAVLLGDEAAQLNASRASKWRESFEVLSVGFDSRHAVIIGEALPEGWTGEAYHVKVALPKTPLDLFGHLAAKLVFNTVSTATMGKYGRLQGNWMAHVDASNKKLYDRSVRLIVELAEVDYMTACVELFRSIDEMKDWDEARKRTTSPAAYTVKRLKAARAPAAKE